MFWAKSANAVRIQAIYKELLGQCENWNTKDIEQVSSWADSGLLQNSKGGCTECDKLKFFIDGNNAIFQGQFCFIMIDSENMKSSALRNFLAAFKIKILNQSDFELVANDEKECEDLANRLRNIIPYFKVLVESAVVDQKS